MNIEYFIGKTVNIDELKNASDVFRLPEEIADGDSYYYEYGQYTFSEIFLSQFKYEGSYDSSGYNAYSIKVIVDRNIITEVLRIGHCHFCNNEGSDYELDECFPYESLEDEAVAYLNSCINNI